KRQGGFSCRYEILPCDVQRKIQANITGLNLWEVPEAGRPLAEIENEMAVFAALRPKYQEIARARALILSAAADYIRENGLGRKKGRDVFCRLYLEHGIQGLPPEVYKRVRLVSRATLELWGKAFKRGGLTGLAPRATNSGRNSKLTSEALMFLRSCLS